MTLKIIDSFIATVDPNRATVVSFPEFILTFGGTISVDKPKPSSKPKSQRDAFVIWLKKNRPKLAELLLLPESYNDWNHFDTYSDLLLFESDLGYLTSAVLLFLEAPGSIAELGAFSQIDSLSERLIIVVADKYHPAKSFISLGPIRSVEVTQRHLNSVCVVPNVPPHKLVAHIPVIVDTLEKKQARVSSGEKFDPTDRQHQILLVLDFINLFAVVQATELQRLSAHFTITLNTSRLDQILFTLERAELIIRQRYGGIDYFLPKKFRQQYVDYTSSTSRFNRTTVKAEAWDEIKNKDKYRKHAQNLVAKKISPIK